MALEQGLVHLWRILVDFEMWREWHRRTSFNFKELGVPLVSLEIESELYFDRDKFEKKFGEKNESSLAKFFTDRIVPIPILALPKKNLLLDESIRVNGERGYRVNRVVGSNYVAAILFSLYPSTENDKMVYRVLRSMAAYAPAEDCEREYFNRICQRYTLKNKIRDLREWITPRLDPYGYLDEVLQKVLTEENQEFVNLIHKIEDIGDIWIGEEPVKNVAFNPLLAIQDYFSLYKDFPEEINMYFKAAHYIVTKHYDWHLEWYDTEDELVKDKLERRLATISDFLGEKFWAFVKVPLEFNKDILVSHKQKIPTHPWLAKRDKIARKEKRRRRKVGDFFTFPLGDARSLHIGFQLPSNVMIFRKMRKKMIGIKYLTDSGKWNIYVEKDPIKVFGRIHMSAKSKHFYTTKKKVVARDSKNKRIAISKMIEIRLKQRLNTITIISLFSIFVFVLALAGATVATGHPALWGSLALASTLLVSFTSLPREDPAFVRQAKWWLIFIGVSIFLGLGLGFISMLSNLFPWWISWEDVLNSVLSFIGL